MRAPKIQFYQDEKSNLEKRWREIGLNKDRSDTLSDDYRQIDEGVAQIETRLMNVDSVAANYEVFYNLEEQSGISLNNLAIGMPFDGSGLSINNNKLTHFSAVPCQISMNGTLAQILSFLDLLDRQDFIVKMDLLSVRAGGTGINLQNQEDSLNASMRCYVLAAKDE